MNRKFSIVFSFIAVFTFFSVNSIAQVKKATPAKAAVSKQTVAVNPSVKVKDNAVRIKVTTDSGILIIKLYDSTPLHRDNFIKLIGLGFYDSLLFHRVIPGFMIQGGDPQSKYAAEGSMLGNGGGDMERIPAEFNKNLYHRKGVLAAARDGNPQKASSACQFYIVDGRVSTDAELNNIEASKGFKYTQEQRNAYKMLGGTPFLDQDYTVFGEVESGLDVISKISHVPCNSSNRPLGNIRMHIEVLHF